MRHSRPVLAFLAGTTLVIASLYFGSSAVAVPHPLLDPANGHPHFDNGKALAHPSAGTEVAFDEQRAEAADVQSSVGSDTPPDATASSLGCANRGSATNPRTNRDCTLRRQAEEQVAVNPTDGNNIIVGQNDSRVGFNRCGFDYSLDGGVTWGDGQPPFGQHLSPIGHTYDAASDPALTFDGNGRAWYSCVVFDVNSNASGLFVVPSTPALKGSAYANVGAGSSPFVVGTEDASGAHFFDKEFIAGDMRAGHTEVYVTWTDFRADPRCKRSMNRGGFCEAPIMLSKWVASPAPGHWTTPLEISGRSPLCTLGDSFNPRIPADSCNIDQGSMPVVLADGSVFVVFNNFNTPTLVNQQLGVHVSADLQTVSAPAKVGVDDETFVALCNFGRGPEQCVDSLNIRSQDFPQIAVDPTNSQHLAAVWTDTRGLTTATRGAYKLIVSESTDGGATWSDASGGGAQLAPSGTGAYFEPSVAITTTGKVVVSTYRANTARHTTAVGDGTFGYGYLVKSGTSFGTYQGASDLQNYPSPQTNAAQAGFLGDYSSVAAGAGGAVYMVWSDTRNTNSAGPDEDVFVFKVTP
ncbi:MAG TPA: hypothetical protein VGS01_02260 [Candidatus Limnocylindria bacterium]|nr:hypothetical protein [Candidatus Limnocylindria bacterium]